MVLIEGYHGTNAELIPIILRQGFNESMGDHHWLGDGTYFFIEGQTGSAPKGAAVKWAIVEAYDKVKKRNNYDRYGVLQCTIKIDDKYLLDLTTLDGMKIFNKIRNQFLRKLEESDYVPKTHTEFKDGHIINLARSKLNIPIEGVKGDFYIRFKVERVNRVSFRIPNCTILAVKDINRKIKQDSLSCVINKKIDPDEI